MNLLTIDGLLVHDEFLVDFPLPEFLVCSSFNNFLLHPQIHDLPQFPSADDNCLVLLIFDLLWREKFPSFCCADFLTLIFFGFLLLSRIRILGLDVFVGLIMGWDFVKCR
ncbi:hypothetical protein Droror1_Dr00013714 [Drosera rotundifolia]